VRYVRHERNRGPTANFNFLFEQLRGEYVMLLADDDWLDDDYVATCLAELRRSPAHAVVGGRHRWMRDGEPAGDGVLMTLEENDPCSRVVRYLRSVDDNGSFYGLIRGDALRRVGPMPNVLGNDWLHVAALAFCGKIRTLPQTRINRSLGGTSRTLGEIVQTFGSARAGEARFAFVFIAARAFAQTGWRSPAYATLGRPQRLLLAARAFCAALHVKGTIWLLLGPPVLGVLRRPRGRALAAPFRWLVRRAGRDPDALPPA
jgi:glycosyltransferase involved in cell wall biosynthesis